MKKLTITLKILMAAGIIFVGLAFWAHRLMANPPTNVMQAMLQMRGFLACLSTLESNPEVAKVICGDTSPSGILTVVENFKIAAKVAQDDLLLQYKNEKEKTEVIQTTFNSVTEALGSITDPTNSQEVSAAVSKIEGAEGDGHDAFSVRMME